MIRKPAVAGSFYPSDANALKRQLNSFFGDTNTPKENAVACILPHAGYIYSGKVTTQTAASIEIKENIILLGPNHTGLGDEFSIVSEGKWLTPFGEVKINSTICENLKKQSSLITENANAHLHEHSLEVQLPILQFLSKKEFSFVPLILMPASKSEYEAIAEGIYKTLSQLNIIDKTLIVASSDMTHYEPQESAQRKDNLAIEAILNLDEDLLIERIKKYNISMCGYVPAVIAIIAAKRLDAKKAKLVKYMTSGETTGDYDAVVGYAGIIIK